MLFWLSVIKYDYFFFDLIQIWSKEPPLILLIDLFTLDEDFDHFYLTSSCNVEYMGSKYIQYILDHKKKPKICVLNIS